MASLGLRGQVSGGEVLPRGGDVQGAQVGAAKRGRGDLADRELDEGVETAVGGVAAQFAGTPDGEPEAAFGVQGQAVGDAPGYRDEAAAVAQRAGVRVMVCSPPG